VIRRHEKGEVAAEAHAIDASRIELRGSRRFHRTPHFFANNSALSTASIQALLPAEPQ
jgi:hypothetical protein